MKKSNLVFSSNVYVLNGHGKLSDPTFMAHVIDPGAIRAMVEHQRKMGGMAKLSPLQKEIYDNAIPCAYSNGDYTHGSINENGTIVCVNKCENDECVYFSKCSKTPEFRKVYRDPDATFDFVEKENETEIEFSFDIDLPEVQISKKIFVPKLTAKTFHLPTRQPEIEEIVRNNKANEWGVRSHVRHLADGTTTIVRGHVRRHWAPTTVTYVVKKEIVSKLLIKKNFINRDLIKKLAERRAQKAIENAIITPQIYQLKKIQPIDSAEVIISSSLNSKILVNAGPGTGKTHTVIERLKYIAREYDDIDPDSILVLCFSRSAVKVIRDRLNKAMDAHEIPYIAKRFNILTFDSFATWFLKRIEPNFDLSPYDYDERIGRFIEKYEKDPEILGVEYLIIDEVQDLVGKRAEMVRSLLKYIKCGFLLLGDECQAIYDYQINYKNELNASKLYEWFETYFNENLIEYELTKEWRHQGVLEEAFKPLRHAMQFKPYSNQKEQLSKLFKKYDIPEMDTEDIIYCCDGDLGKRAILSWANGDAYRQSQELFARDDISVKHTILTGARKLLLRKELALILSKLTIDTVNKRTFLGSGKAVGINDEVVTAIWDAILFTLEMDSDNEEFSLLALRKALISEKRVDEVLTSQEESDVIISTIHKAKGKEYDTVVLNKFGSISNSDDVKVYYVALTRTKGELIVKSKQKTPSYDIKTDSGRFIELNKQYKIKRIELGIDGDVDPIGFIDKGLTGFTPEKRQDYIVNKVKIGDPLRISKYKGDYLLIHEGHAIGRVKPSAFKQYRHYFPSGKHYTYSFDKYTDYVDIFVKDIVSVVNQKLDSAIPEPYSKSGFWLGIEFCGYAKPMEE